MPPGLSASSRVNEVNTIAFHPQQYVCVTASDDHMALAWDLTKDSVLRKLNYISHGQARRNAFRKRMGGMSVPTHEQADPRFGGGKNAKPVINKHEAETLATYNAIPSVKRARERERLRALRAETKRKLKAKRKVHYLDAAPPPVEEEQPKRPVLRDRYRPGLRQA